jgi:predicted permease
MSLTSRVQSWLRAGLRRSRLEDQMDSEMRFHIARYVEDLEREGVAADEARRRALAEFGSVEARKDECREAVGLRIMGEALADCRYALRALKASPGFAVIAVLSLGLGIGANSAIFSLMETALWKTAPVKKPEQLRLLSWTSGPKTVMDSTWSNLDDGTVFSYAVFQAFQRGNTHLATVFGFKPAGNATAIVDGHAELARCHLISGNFYEATEVSTIAGRPIAPSDDTRQSVPVATISYAYWQRRFGGDGSTIGRQIRLNQVPVTIVGVNPAGFTGIVSGENPDVFVPIALQPRVLPKEWPKGKTLLDDPNSWWVEAMVRMAPGNSEDRVRAALDVELRQAVLATLPVKGKDLPRLRLRAGARGLDELGEEAGTPLRLMLALVTMVLLIACANVANLLLARATARQREISMRMALGAGRWRITRQMLTEGLLLSTMGGGLGVLLGYWMRDAIPNLLRTPWEPPDLQAQFDVRVLAISLAVTLFTGVLFSLAPVWQASRVDPNSALKEGTRSTTSLPRLLAGKSLVVFQVALSVLLLVGAGLFARTLSNLKSEKPGFRPERLLLFAIDPPRTPYAGARRVALFEELERRIAAIPGVQSSTLSASVLIGGGNNTTEAVPDWRGPRPGRADRTWVNQVGSRFFETMGIPVLYGRSIDARDGPKAPRVAVVNQRFAREFFPKGDALGRTFHLDPKEIYQIVGICGDTHFDRLQSAIPPTFYSSFQQAEDLREMNFEVKTAAGEAGIMQAVREAVRSVDRDLPVFAVRTQMEQIDDTLSKERIFAALTSAFGVLALVLASIGIYGVMAYGVGRRTSEIGVRLALGAQSRQVLGMILREAAALAGIGLIIGAGAAMGLTHFVASMLYGLKASDPLTLGAAVLVMLAVALFAGWWPARRAARLDPMAALRHE